MADGSVSVPSLTANTAPIQSLVDSQKDRPQELKAATAQYASDEARASETETKELGAEEKTAGAMVPPKLEVPPEPKVKTTNPQQIWASAAMMLAGLAPLLTRTPLTTAMNAASQVLTAYRTGDQEAANAAFATWKQASENAIQMANFQQKAYDEALAGVERRERLTIEERGQADREAEAKFRATASAFNDETAFARFQEGGLKAVAELQEQRQKWAEQIEEHMPKLVEQHAFMQAANKLFNDPRYQELQQKDPVQAYRLLMQIQSSAAPSMQMKPEQQNQAAEKIQRDIRSDPMYKAWEGAHTSASEIGITLNKLKDGSISETVAADQFTRAFNGGNAIRGFQQKMLTDHASLYQQAQVFAKKFQNGGLLSNDQLQVMGQAAQFAVQYMNQQMAGQVLQAYANAAQEGITHPEAAIPEEVMSSIQQDPGSWPHQLVEHKPPPAAVQKLKTDPSPQMKSFFDQKYGQGAADSALGGGGG
jgi:hypothetical protein